MFALDSRLVGIDAVIAALGCFVAVRVYKSLAAPRSAPEDTRATSQRATSMQQNWLAA
jgi:hypothetical protein